MTTMTDIRRDAQNELRDRYKDYRDEFDDGPHDVIHEIADSAVPIYTTDRMTALASDLGTITRDLDLADGIEHPDIVTLAGIAIYEDVTEALWDAWDEIEEDDDE